MAKTRIKSAEDDFGKTCPGGPASDAELYARLDTLAIVHTTHEHAPVFTVEEARALRRGLPGVHCKCLFLKSKKGQLVLVVAREGLRVDLKWLEHELGLGRLSFGKPELLMASLGVVPGSVTPFGLINDQERKVCPVLDATMLEGETVNFHPLRNDKTTALSPEGLLRFIQACGHSPHILRFPET